MSDLSGMIFGFLTVQERVHVKGSHNPMWLCLCECGATKPVAASSLRSGGTVSCGCKRHSLRIAKISKHGMSRTPEYVTWTNMIRRCTNADDISYPDYGAKGVTVCDRWITSFEAFFSDMGKRPSSKHSIDRIQRTKGYSPDNCRWATTSEQSRNRSDNKFLTIGTTTKCYSDWCRELNLEFSNLYRTAKKRNTSVGALILEKTNSLAARSSERGR